MLSSSGNIVNNFFDISLEGTILTDDIIAAYQNFQQQRFTHLPIIPIHLLEKYRTHKLSYQDTIIYSVYQYRKGKHPPHTNKCLYSNQKMMETHFPYIAKEVFSRALTTLQKAGLIQIKKNFKANTVIIPDFEEKYPNKHKLYLPAILLLTNKITMREKFVLAALYTRMELHNDKLMCFKTKTELLTQAGIGAIKSNLTKIFKSLVEKDLIYATDHGIYLRQSDMKGYQRVQALQKRVIGSHGDIASYKKYKETGGSETYISEQREEPEIIEPEQKIGQANSDTHKCEVSHFVACIYNNEQEGACDDCREKYIECACRGIISKEQLEKDRRLPTFPVLLYNDIQHFIQTRFYENPDNWTMPQTMRN